MARSRIYSFLASLFHDSPTRESIEKLQGGAFLDSVGNLLPEEDIKALKGANVDLDELAVEHTSLFFAPTPSFVRPHERDHRPELAEGTWRGKVEEAYRKCGFTLDSTAPESSDFIGVELDFMAALCAREAEAMGREVQTFRKLEKRFLDEHISKWTGSLCNEIHNKAKSDLLRGIGRLLGAFIEMDRMSLEELSGPKRPPSSSNKTKSSKTRPKTARRKSATHPKSK